MDGQSTKLVLVALLRAVSRMKGVLEESDRAVLKDLVVEEPLQPELLRIGIRMAILDNDARSGSPQDDQVHLAKRRDLLKQLWDLCKGRGEQESSSEGEYEDDYESDDDDADMMLPDDEAVRDDEADSTAERGDEEEDTRQRVREIAETVARQKELLAEKMRFVEEQLARLTDLKAQCEARAGEARHGGLVLEDASEEDESGEDEETDEETDEEETVDEESWDDATEEWDDDDDIQEFERGAAY